MQYGWLEEMTKQGNISEEARDEIYADCGGILKEGASAEAIKSSLNSAANLLLGLGAFAGYGALRDHFETKGMKDQLVKNKAFVMASSDFPTQEDKSKASARFDEMARLAPTVAINPDISHKFVKSRLHTGMTDRDVEKLTQLQATYLPDMSKQMAITPKTASVYGGLMGDMYIMSKTAGPRPITDILRNYGLLAAIPVGVGIGTGLMKEFFSARDQKKLEANLENSFREALKASDPNKEPLHENKAKAREAFQSLAHFAPNVASQPQAARAFMNKIVAYDQGMHVGDIKELSEIERNLGQSQKPDPFSTGFGAGTEATGLKNISSKAIESIGREHMGIM